MMAIPEGMRFGRTWKRTGSGWRVTMVSMVGDDVVGEFRGYLSEWLATNERRREVEREGVEYLVGLYEWQQSRMEIQA